MNQIEFNEAHFKRIWTEMKQRCNNPNHQKFKFYGAIGVKVCDEWQTYANFKNDMLDSYIDFISVNGEKNISLCYTNNVYSKNTSFWQIYNINTALNSNVNKYLYNGNLYNLTELHENFCQNLSLRGFADRVYKAGYKDKDEITDDSIFYQYISPISFITDQEEYEKQMILNSYDLAKASAELRERIRNEINK